MNKTTMTSEYKITLIDRNEALMYEDSFGVLKFNIEYFKGIWRVFIPESLDNVNLSFITLDQRDRIFQRIASYLETYGWFRIFGYRAKVDFLPEMPPNQIRLLANDVIQKAREKNKKNP